jgi:hypothetical protein
MTRKKGENGAFISPYSNELCEMITSAIIDDGVPAVMMSKKHNVPGSTIRNWVSKKRRERALEHMGPNTTIDAQVTTKTKTVKDRLADFAMKHDNSTIIPESVRTTIVKWLSKESVVWAYDADMQIQCGIKNPALWKRYARENPEFEHLTFKLPGTSKLVWVRSEEERDELQRRALR